MKSTIVFTVTIESPTKEQAVKDLAYVAGNLKALFHKEVLPREFPPLTLEINETRVNGENCTVDIQELHTPLGMQ